ARVVPLGEHRLRGLDRPESLSQVGAPGDRAGFPALRTLPARPTNLPAQATTFVGRETELLRLRDLLLAPHPGPVTLTGPAGVGKSRLAIRAASDLLDRFEGGCWFADLSDVRDPGGLADAVLQALSVPGETKPVEQVGDLLRTRPPLLLVLDTFDHLAAGCRGTVRAWVECAPESRVLITSRSSTGIPGEREERLEPFPLPDGPASDAVRLFCERARESKPDFGLTAENLPDVVSICRELDGIPLAIELAASRIRILQPGAMLRKLGQKFQLLRSLRQDAAPRQQTLSGAIEWSLELLTPAERRVFEKLSVFRGGFVAGVAADVIGPEASPEVIESLRKKSLLSARDYPWGRRHLMYRLIHEYAGRLWSQSATPAERRALEIRHAEAAIRYVRSLDAAARPELHGEMLERLGAASENLSAVTERALSRLASATDDAEAIRDLEFAAAACLALVRDIGARGSAAEWHQRIREVVAALESRPTLRPRMKPDLVVALLEEEALAARAINDGHRSRIAVDAAVSAAEDSGDGRLIAKALLARVRSRTFLGDLDGALRDCLRGEELTGNAAAAALRGPFLHSRSLIFKRQGRFEESHALVRTALELAVESGDLWQTAQCAISLGSLCELLNRTDEALSWYELASRQESRQGRQVSRLHTLGHRASILSRVGRHAEAMAMLEEAEALARVLGRRRFLGNLSALRTAILRRSGKAAEALAASASAIEAIRASGDTVQLAGILWERGSILQDLGRLEEAEPQLAEARAVFEMIPHPAGVLQCRLSEAQLWVAQGRLEEARAVMRPVLDLSREIPDFMRIQCLATLASVESARGDRAAAAEAARAFLRIHEATVWQGATQVEEMEALAVKMRALVSV
ncbi:MAG: tetratricopeptide repeat protein, partial [Candidatus Brocadiae bacterium]|nr:tetratricopeptide repeat protein [Candidatus Brocadiia bacterium]